MSQENKGQELVTKMNEQAKQTAEETVQKNMKELNELVNSTKDVTVKQVLDHKDCGNAECPICSLKNNIDKEAYERGLNDGVELHAKKESEQSQDW